MSNYAKHLSVKKTPQSEAIPGKNQVNNNAGGFVFEINDWKRLDRFLVLGCEGGTYYSSERQLTKENADVVLRCLALDYKLTVDTIVNFSYEGQAPKQDPAIFALALCASLGSNEAKSYALSKLSAVCRIPTHLFNFVAAAQELRGWGRGLRSGIAKWYTDKDLRQLSYQCSKYVSRNGWSHRDLLRLSHVKTADETRNEILHWCARGWEGVGEEPHPKPELLPIWAFEKAKRATDEKEIIKLINNYDLVRECIPTQFLNSAAVWEALLEKMPMTAMVRNLGKMSAIGLLSPLSVATNKIMNELGDIERIKNSRIHPIQLLSALKTYGQGHGEKGKLSWSPVSQVVDALDSAFYKAFKAVVPTGLRWLLALDVSGSMGIGTIAGLPGLNPRLGSAAMALVTAAVEPQHAFVAFTSGGWDGRHAKGQHSGLGYTNGITPLTISPRQRIDDVVKTVSALPMGGTDCALPILYATAKNIPVDVFVSYTDSETWAGNVHPVQALKEYRQKMGINARMIVVGMTSSGFSIADPSDSGMLDVVGFDSTAPALMSKFALGNI